jgi:hypothetical protein
VRRGTSCRTLLLALVSCSSSSVPAQAVDGGGGGGESGPPACTASGPCTPSSGGSECVSVVHAKLVKADGSGAAGVPVFVCGTNVCSLPASTASDGTATLTLCLEFAGPALKVFDDPAWVPFAALLRGAGPSFDATVQLTPLPAAGGVLAPGTNTSGPVTLDVSGTVTFDLEHATPASRGFRAALAGAGAFAGTGLAPSASQMPDVVWGLAPLNTKLSPPGTLTVPNMQPNAWPAGMMLHVALDGTDTTTATPPAPWGTWGEIGTAHVSADGKTITTDDGAGIPELAPVLFHP